MEDRGCRVLWGADREVLQVDQGVWGSQRDKGGKSGVDRELGLSRKIQRADTGLMWLLRVVKGGWGISS